jgi:6-phosphogluconolactonase
MGVTTTGANIMYPWGQSLYFSNRSEESMKGRILSASLLLLLIICGLTGCISGNKQFAYVTGPGTNEVFQFQIHSNGSLTPLNPANVASGSNPTSVAFRPAGDFAYISNSAGNNVTLLAVNKGNGQLTVPVSTSPIPQPTPPNIFNTGTGPIAVVPSPAAPFLYVLNVGSNDISGFVINPANGDLQAKSPVCSVPNSTPPPTCQVANTLPLTITPGMAITPKGNLLFVGNPALLSISVFSIGSNGDLSSAGAPVSLGVAPAGLLVEPSGRFLYVADKANNRVLGFSIQSNGALSALSGSPFAAGAQPVSLATDAGGVFLYVANQGSNNVSAYLIDSGTGALGAISGSPFATGGRGPTFVAASGSFVYVTEQTTNDIAAFSIGSTGALAAVPGSPFNVAVSPQWISLLKE